MHSSNMVNLIRNSNAAQHSVLRTAPGNCPKLVFFLETWLFLSFFVARRSLVENDRPPSFPGAPDPRRASGPWWWESAHALRAVRQFVWLQVGPVKSASSRPA